MLNVSPPQSEFGLPMIGMGTLYQYFCDPLCNLYHNLYTEVMQNSGDECILSTLVDAQDKYVDM